MKVRLKTGLRAGDEIEVPDDVGAAFVVSGKAEQVEVSSGRHAASDEVETPEDDVAPAPTPRRRRKSPAAETR